MIRWYMRLFALLAAFMGLLLAGMALAEPQTPSSWYMARKMASTRWQGHATLYCGCSWSSNGRGGGTLSGQCGWSSARYANRAARIEWEHIVPASWLVQDFACYQQPDTYPGCTGLTGRKCCERHDPEAQQRLFDIDNLAPVMGAANAERSAEPYGLITGENLAFGSCDFESNHKVTEPRPASRSYIASITLSMTQRYPDLRISNQYRALMESWLP